MFIKKYISEQLRKRTIRKIAKDNSTFEHVMIDIETLGLSPTSVITEVAVTFFNPANYSDRPNLGTTVCWKIDWCKGQEQRTIDPETLQWALKQKLVSKRLSESDRHPLKDVLSTLHLLITDSHKVWSRGPDFDITLLTNAYSDYVIPTPWKFWNSRCVRTEIDRNRSFLAPLYKSKALVNEHKHSASGDTIFQAKIISLCLYRKL